MIPNIYDINKTANLALSQSGIENKYVTLEPEHEAAIAKLPFSELKQRHFLASHEANGLTVHKNPHFSHVKNQDWLILGSELALESKYRNRG
jgi:hypothetical protein